jgi:beta-glucanase (GH16 family)
MKTVALSRAGFILLFILLACSPALKSQSLYNKLVWSEEFNYKGLPDTSKWSYDRGNGCPNVCGWGNNELQFYTWMRSENARVEDGHLVIEARREEMQGLKYTSARLITKNKGDWKYGRIEIKALLPAGRGMWPAIWMMPTHGEYGGWPKSGEIDIMENVGYWPDSVIATVHTNAYNGMLGTQKTKGIHHPGISSTFHVYSIEWTPEAMSFYMDGQPINHFKNDKTGFAAWPFDKEFHLLLNIAVGGNWGGKYGVDDAVFPQKMLVDWVRVYQ